MTIEVDRIDTGELDAWDDHVEASTQGTVFHTSGWLRAMERRSGGRLHPLVGYKGQEMVGLFPLFELTKGPITAVFSPPPRLGVPHLGPVLRNFQKLKRRKFDRRNRQFVEGCLEWADEEIAQSYTYVTTVPEYRDVRPFDWAGFDVTPNYTYAVPTFDDNERLMDHFASSARRAIRDIRDADCVCAVKQRDKAGAEFVIRQVRDRYESQDKRFDLDASFIDHLYRSLSEDDLKVYVGEVDGERVSGIIAPADSSTVYFWMGGVKPETDQPINELLHWSVLTDAAECGQENYDLVGANTPHICRYKTKFNPQLVPYYELERSTPLTKIASTLYRRMR